MYAVKTPDSWFCLIDGDITVEGWTGGWLLIQFFALLPIFPRRAVHELLELINEI